MKLSIVIESESPGPGVRTEYGSNFPALICFHYLSKAIIFLFNFHSPVWYERAMQRGKRSACVLLTSKHVTVCYTGNNICSWIPFSHSITEEVCVIVVPFRLCLLMCMQSVKMSLTTLQHREQAWSHHPQRTQWICSEVFWTTRK